MTHVCEKVGPEYLDEARWRFDAHEIVAATPERVFDVFRDAAAWPRWAPPITSVEWTCAFPLEVGSTRTVTMVGDLVGHEEFITWDPPREMAFRFNEVSRPGVSAFAERYRVHDLGDGRSLVEWTMAMTPDGPGARVFPLTAPVLGAAVRYMLGRLRRHVESTPAAAASTGGAP
ncbi:MAG: SRPBCC family protein [Microthrixaceae bacterium]